MGRGYIFAATLAALGAVFLQGCGKKAPPPPPTPPPTPAPTQVVTTLTAPAAKGAEQILVANNAGFAPNSKVTITDPTAKVSELNAVKAVRRLTGSVGAAGTLTLMAPLQNNYGLSSIVTMNIADEGKVTSLADITTSATVISEMEPRYIRPSTIAQTFKLTGSAVLGDRLFFTNATNCDEKLPTSPVTIVDATNSTVLVGAMTVVDVYKICYQQVGRTDFVAQTAAEAQLNIQLAQGTQLIQEISPTEVEKETLTSFTLNGTSAVGDKGAFVAEGKSCPLASSFMSWWSIANGTMSVKTPATAGNYSLCILESKTGTVPEEQTDPLAQLTVKESSSRLYAIMDDDIADNTEPVNSTLKNIVLGAGGAMLVAFVILGVKKANSGVRALDRNGNYEQVLEEDLE